MCRRRSKEIRLACNPQEMLPKAGKGRIEWLSDKYAATIFERSRSLWI